MKHIHILLLLFILAGCASPRYIEIPVDNIKVEYRDRTSIDTIIKNDSIVIRERGDTVFKETYKFLYKVNRTKDTINITDTITKVKTVEVIKNVNTVHNWQIVLMVLGGAAIISSLYSIIKYIKQTWI